MNCPYGNIAQPHIELVLVKHQPKSISFPIILLGIIFVYLLFPMGYSLLLIISSTSIKYRISDSKHIIEIYVILI